MRKTLMVGVVSLLMASAAARADEWRVQAIDGNAGACSIAVDGKDVPHLAFTYRMFGDLYYGRREPATGWAFETVYTRSVVEVSLRVDDPGTPRIAHTTYLWPDGALHLADKSSGSWVLEDVVARTAGSPSLAVAPGGASSIAYFDAYDGSKMFLAHQRGGVWVTPQLTNNSVVATSMALDSAGRPHIAYLDLDERSLKYARFTGTSWVFERVDSLSTSPLGRPSLALDRVDRPVIGYSSGTEVRVARKMGGLWHPRLVEPVESGAVGVVSLGIDGGGGVHLTYGASPMELHYARQFDPGPVWNVQVVDRFALGLYGVSMALDSTGHAHIAYVAEDGLFELRYATNATDGSVEESALLAVPRQP
jgi:hypothetical protein